ncbi:hypothetical protein [Corynebacterium callunae]|uniref:hypothetical protein n=1 Tax=Corynebacterium callunae TaxID=1721 RepID=UPI001FFFE40F|nr:hypothetical protein [Corynebacterium callunae]MCK2199378.1 hypothetical protein [Corynebacterium callunae]
MKKLPAIFTALALAGTSIAIPQAASAQGVTYAQAYSPYDWTYDETDVTTSATVGLIYGLPSSSSTYKVDFTWGTSPYPVSIRQLSSTYIVYVSLNLEAIYPERFDVPYTAKITYSDGSVDTVSGLMGIQPSLVLVKDGEPIPEVSTPMATTTVTTTVTPAPVTETVTLEPTPTTVTEIVTETATETVTEIPETSTVTVTKEPTPTTVTETKTATQTVTAAPVTETKTATATTTVTKEPTPTTVTETKTVAPVTKTETVTTTAKPAAESGSSANGGVLAAILALIAAIGGGAFFWFTNLQ